MLSTPISQLIPTLQVAIGPVILISGIGLLLLTLTNRFGRAVDRSRQLAREKCSEGSDARRVASQVAILYRRASLIRLAITMGAVSVLFVSTLIILIFLATLLRIEAGGLITLLFICCMLSLIVSLSAFIREINLSLVALKVELQYQQSNSETSTV